MKRIKITNEEWNALEKVADNAHNDWFYEETFHRATLDVNQIEDLLSSWMDVNVEDLTKEELDRCKAVFTRARLYAEWVADIYNEFYPKAESEVKLAKEEELLEKAKADYDYKKSGCCKYMAVPNFEISTSIIKDWDNTESPVNVRVYPNGISFYGVDRREIFSDNVLFYGQTPMYKDWLENNMDKIFSCLYKYHTIVNGEYRFHNGLKSIQKLAEGNPIYERQIEREIFWKVKGFKQI